MNTQTPQRILSDIEAMRSILASRMPAEMRDRHSSVQVSIVLEDYSPEQIEGIRKEFKKTDLLWELKPAGELFILSARIFAKK